MLASADLPANVAPVVPGVDGVLSQLLLNPQQLVVLGQPLRPAASTSSLSNNLPVSIVGIPSLEGTELRLQMSLMSPKYLKGSENPTTDQPRASPHVTPISAYALREQEPD